VLAAACSGRLTAAWREEEPNLQPASKLLEPLLPARRRQCDRDENTLPELPDEWTWITADTISSAIVDCPHSTPRWTDSGRVCLRTTNFHPGKLDLAEVRFVSEATYQDRIQRLEPKAGDVVYSREGGILGIACIIPPGVTVCLGQRMMLFRLHHECSAI